MIPRIEIEQVVPQYLQCSGLMNPIDDRISLAEQTDLTQDAGISRVWLDSCPGQTKNIVDLKPRRHLLFEIGEQRVNERRCRARSSYVAPALVILRESAESLHPKSQDSRV